MNKIYVIMGKSATGKDTIYNSLLKKEGLNLKEIVLYTTRPKRNNEVDGKEYVFVDIDKLNELKEDNKVIECRTYNTIHGQWSYFTVDENIFLDKYNYIMIGTIEAYSKIKSYFGHSNVIPLYIEVDDGTRLSRALNRELTETNPKFSEMCRRYLADEVDFSNEKLIQAGINKKYNNYYANECIDEIVLAIKNIM